MGPSRIARLAIPGVALLVAFLAYTSQWLFRHIDPHALDRRQSITFNAGVACIWICYLRACFIDPGRFPRTASPSSSAATANRASRRWCLKCEAPKPPRAHHCKQCGRCIPRMDHHCPWTLNCVSYTTLPHFIRFLFYAVAAMSHLAFLLFIRIEVLWTNRKLPSARLTLNNLRLTTKHADLIHLLVLCLVNSLTLFALFILLARTLWSVALNTTTIEGWEIERHAALVRRARLQGGYAYGPDGVKVRIVRQEFPYDVGVWRNIKQGMGGTGNILSWFWPFAATPSVESGMEFVTNGFEDPNLPWPPIDPERIPRKTQLSDPTTAFTYADSVSSPTDQMEAFRRRQHEDVRRRQRSAFQAGGSTDGEDQEPEDTDALIDSEEDLRQREWRNSDGEALQDFGVDEETETYLADDDIPLAELLRRRKGG